MNYKLNIKEIRLKKGLKQKDLSENLELSRSFLSELERDKYNIKLSLLLDIANILNVDEKELYTKIEKRV